MATAEWTGIEPRREYQLTHGKSLSTKSVEHLADDVLTVSMIVGAVLGAVAGMGLWAATGTTDPRGAGIVGTLVGGGLAGLFGRYVVLPLLAVFHPASAAPDLGAPEDSVTEATRS